MACDILAIPVSSVASESTFSSSRKIVTHNRSSLTPKTIEALMCLQDWYREKMNAGKCNCDNILLVVKRVFYFSY